MFYIKKKETRKNNFTHSVYSSKSQFIIFVAFCMLLFVSACMGSSTNRHLLCHFCSSHRLEVGEAFYQEWQEVDQATPVKQSLPHTFTLWFITSPPWYTTMVQSSGQTRKRWAPFWSCSHQKNCAWLWCKNAGRQLTDEMAGKNTQKESRSGKRDGKTEILRYIFVINDNKCGYELYFIWWLLKEPFVSFSASQRSISFWKQREDVRLDETLSGHRGKRKVTWTATVVRSTAWSGTGFH